MNDVLQAKRQVFIGSQGSDHTDIDAKAVAVARAGRYRKDAPGLSPERVEHWFTTVGSNLVPVPEIRDMCVFSTHSLVKDPPFSKLDLISCRNVMIYLDDELQDRVMRAFHYGLLPGGYLFLGTAESVTRKSRLTQAREVPTQFDRQTLWS